MVSAFCVLFKKMFVFPKVMKTFSCEAVLFYLYILLCCHLEFTFVFGLAQVSNFSPPREYPVDPAPCIHRIVLSATFVRGKVMCAIDLFVSLYDSSILPNYCSLLLTLEILIALFFQIVLAIPGSLHSYICQVAQG